MTSRPALPLTPKTLPILRRAVAYLAPYRRLVIAIYAAMMAINLFNVAMPQFIRVIIDRGVYGGDQAFLGWAVIGLLGITALKGLLIYFQGGWTEVASQRVAYDLRNEVMHKLNNLSFAFHDRTESGQILSRTIQDVERIRFLTGRAILRIIEGTVLILLTAGILVWMDPSLGGLILLTVPLIGYRAYMFGGKFRPLSIRIQNQLAVLTTQIEQNLRGAEVVKGFAQEDAEIDRFLAQNETWFGMSAEAARLQSVNVPMLSLIANLGTVIILWYGGTMVVDGTLSLGELVAFTTYLAQLLRPLNLIGRIVPVLAIAASAGERIFDILDAPSDVSNTPNAQPLEQIHGRVTFHDVSFGYDPDHPVLKNVSFTAESGQVIALLGTTGSGKSTIINLLPRFYDPTSGIITIDGMDTRQLPLNFLRGNIGAVMQDTWLFGASLRENIAFGRQGATMDEIEQAARDAQAHEFIQNLPEGFETEIGERGVTLSGGQKQRMAIARALISDPRILILDDATSSVDTQTESLIQVALKRLMHGRTTFVIAHRLSTVREADLILVLEKGEVVAQGTHEELLEGSPMYAEVYNLQLRPEAIQAADTAGGLE